MKIRYARVSTIKQHSGMQIIALEDASFEKIYEEVVSGAKNNRSTHLQCRKMGGRPTSLGIKGVTVQSSVDVNRSIYIPPEAISV